MLTLLGLLLLPTNALAQVGADWSMAGANPQRTGWVTQGISPSQGTIKADWYRVVESFIPQKMQVVGGGGNVYIGTSTGVYAFDAGNGDQAWTYATELPIGHTPTFANNTVYAPGMDRRIHAIDSASGQLKSGWTFVEAGAGFETSPLVIGTTVYATNRDGYVYALDANSGALKWKWHDTNDEWVDAPIRHSPAYKSGVLFFGSDNGHMYALNDNGTLKWKSPERLSGVGFSTYWPVVYADGSGKDWVLVEGTKKEVGWVWFGDDYYVENYDLMRSVPRFGFIGSRTNTNGSWLVNGSSILNKYASKPHKQHFFVLDASNGTNGPTAPVLWASVTHGGAKHPPIVSPSGKIYTFMGYQNGNPDDPGLSQPGSVPNAGISGCVGAWVFNTANIEQICDLIRGYADEPVHFSGGGNYIYWAEGYNLQYGAIDVTKSYGSNQWDIPAEGGWADGQQIAPGTHAMYTCGTFGSCQGVYQGIDSAFFPYAGRLYMIDSNSLVSLKPNGPVNKLTSVPPETTPSTASPAALSSGVLVQRLENEVTKMIAAGPLRPGFHDSGLWGQSANGAYHFNSDDVQGDHLAEYFVNPGETVIALAEAYPYVSDSIKVDIKTYLQQHYGPGATYDFTKVVHVGWRNGAQREIYTDSPERAALIDQPENNQRNIATEPRTYIHQETSEPYWQFPPLSVYAGWKYAELFPEQANALRAALTTQMNKNTASINYARYPYFANAYLAGYRGLMELEKMSGTITDITQSSSYAKYQNVWNTRKNFVKNSPYQSVNNFVYQRTMSVSRNFMNLMPEIAAEFANDATLRASVATAVDEYERVEPYWFVTKFDQTYGEGAYHPLYDYFGLFQAKARILGEPYETLTGYVDAPAFWRGDLFYIQNLVAALDASDGPIQPPPGVTPSPPDFNNDGWVNIFDYSYLVKDFASWGYSVLLGWIQDFRLAPTPPPPPPPTATPTAAPPTLTPTPAPTTEPGSAPSPVASYGFNGNANDSSGNGNNGTVSGATYVAGKYGQALKFSGNSHIVTVPDSASLDLSTTMTLMAYVRPTQSHPNWATIFMKTNSNNSDLVYALYLSGGLQNAPEFNIVTSGGTSQHFNFNNALTFGSTAPWTHIAAVYETTQSSQAAVRFYTNGQDAGSNTFISPVQQSTGALTIGANSVWSEEVFTGDIDDVQIFNVALTQQQIQTLMNTPL